MKQTEIYIEFKILAHNWVGEVISSPQKNKLENDHKAYKMRY